MTDLAPPQARALVGQVVAGPHRAAITAKESQRYAQAVGDLNPVYFDEDAARAAGYRTLICPPTFVEHALVVGRSLDELRVDGLFQADDGPDLGLRRVMFAGQEWEWLAPVHVGDTITAEQRLAAVEPKSGSKGPFVLVTWEWTYTNQDGDVVARGRQQGISR
jgi:acyl dehydratase